MKAWRSLPEVLTISKEGNHFLVEDPEAPGSPPVGRGQTMFHAIGNWLHNNQTDLGLRFEVHESARSAEMERRRRELSKR